MPISSPQITRMLGLVDFAITISFQTIQLGRRAPHLRCVAMSSGFLRERKERSGWNDIAFISMSPSIRWRPTDSSIGLFIPRIRDSLPALPTDLVSSGEDRSSSRSFTPRAKRETDKGKRTEQLLSLIFRNTNIAGWSRYAVRILTSDKRWINEFSRIGIKLMSGAELKIRVGRFFGPVCMTIYRSSSKR